MDVHTLWHWWFLRIQWLGNYREARGEIRRNNRGWLRLSDKSSLLAKVSTIYLKLLCILHPPSFIPLGGAFFCVVLSLRIQQSWEGVKPNTSPAIGFGENLLIYYLLSLLIIIIWLPATNTRNSSSANQLIRGQDSPSQRCFEWAFPFLQTMEGNARHGTFPATFMWLGWEVWWSK